MDEFAADHDAVGKPRDVLGGPDLLEEGIDLREVIRHAGTIADRAIIDGASNEEDDACSTP